MDRRTGEEKRETNIKDGRVGAVSVRERLNEVVLVKYPPLDVLARRAFARDCGRALDAHGEEDERQEHEELHSKSLGESSAARKKSKKKKRTKTKAKAFKSKGRKLCFGADRCGSS